MKIQKRTDFVIDLASAIREQANTVILDLLALRGIDDIVPAYGGIFQALFERGPLPMNELAASIRRKKNTVTGLIDMLEKKGYCRRETDPDDARVQLVYLTAKGESMREVQAEISNELLRRTWAGISEQEQQACIQSLQKILRNLQTSEPG